MSTVTDSTAATADRTSADDRWRVLRHRLRIDGAGAPLLAGGLFLVVTALTAAVSAFTEIRISGWEVSTHVVRWFIGGTGVYLAAVYLPLYIAHGLTRRDVARSTAMFMVLYAVLTGALIAVGFLLEGVVYDLAGWTRSLDGGHLFDAPDAFLLVTLEHALVFLVWLGGGALLGAAFYRNGALGLAMIPPALGAVMLIEAAVGAGNYGALWVPPLTDALVGSDALHPMVATATAAVLAGLLAAITWLVVRNLPVRPQSS